MPFADYRDFADCVSRNGDKDSPESYCGAIKRDTEDKQDGPAEQPDRQLTLAVGGRTVRKHKDSQGSTEHHKRAGAPKLDPESSNRGGGAATRDAKKDARSLYRRLDRDVQVAFKEQFNAAANSRDLGRMQSVLDRWTEDPYGAGLRGGTTDLSRALTRESLASTEAVISLHDTPNSPHREHMKGAKRQQEAGDTGRRENSVSWTPDDTKAFAGVDSWGNEFTNVTDEELTEGQWEDYKGWAKQGQGGEVVGLDDDDMIQVKLDNPAVLGGETFDTVAYPLEEVQGDPGMKWIEDAYDAWQAEGSEDEDDWGSLPSTDPETAQREWGSLPGGGQAHTGPE